MGTASPNCAASAPAQAPAQLMSTGARTVTAVPERTVKQLIVGAIQVLVQLERRDGKRRIASIAELKGIDGEQYLLRERKFT